MFIMCVYLFFFFKQKTAYELRISDWSSDVCSSDLGFTGSAGLVLQDRDQAGRAGEAGQPADALRARRDIFVLVLVGHRHEEAVEIGRASCRERVCQYVELWVVAVSLKKKTVHTE